MSRKSLVLLLLVLPWIGLQAGNLTKKVDPIIGTDNHGHVFVGASVPFGAIQVGPTHMGEGWDWCSGYNYTDLEVMGFSHLHMEGTGCSDLCDINLMPVLGEVKLQHGEQGKPETGYFSPYSHERETAKPYYYSVMLDRYGIKAEMTASKYVGFHRYTYPTDKNLRIVIDTENANADLAVDCGVKKLNDRTVIGHRLSRGWAREQFVYFAAEFSEPISEWEVSKAVKKDGNRPVNCPTAYGLATFKNVPGKQVMVKIALSAVSEENALMNLRQDLKGWDFEGTCQAAENAWEEELGRIEATFPDPDQEVSFYTAMYHTMISPNLFSDLNGDYRGSDRQIHRGANFKTYTIWSTWDTYRSYHPMATIIFPEFQHDWQKTLCHIYDEQGYLPIWHLTGYDNQCMVGISSVPILADMCLKGYVKGNDLQTAYEAMKQTMDGEVRELKWMNKYGYIPCNVGVYGFVAETLEYALDNWSVAQVAKLLGKTEDYNHFMKRSRAYQLLYDEKSGFFRGKDDKGVFESSEGFKPNLNTAGYTEGNAWQYLWLVPQDVNGLMKLLGGKKNFIVKLDSLFTVSSDLGESHAIDIAGLVGQYAHGNEPSHHIIYLYNYVGQPWKAADRLREVMKSFYALGPGGLAGNEDMGQMSAWFILSAIGLYQVEPCGGRYVFGSPIVNEAKVKLGGGKTLNITAHNNSATNKYIQKVLFNGKKYTKSYIDFVQIEKGGHLEFFMGPKPSKFGTSPKDCPVSQAWKEK